MIRNVVCMFVMLMGAWALLACRPAAQDFKVQGPEGGIALKVTLPEGFDTATEHCPMVILMHGIFSFASTSMVTAKVKAVCRT